MARQQSPNAASRHRLRLTGIALILPVVVLLAGFAVRWKFDADWHDAIVAAVGPTLTPAQAALTVDRVCSLPGSGDLGTFCLEYGSLTWLTVGAVATAVLGLGLLSLIWVAGRRAHRDPQQIVRLFRPALYLTVGVSIVLVALDAVLTMATLYLVEDAFLGWSLPFLIWAVGGAGLVAIVGMARALLSATRTGVETTDGRVLDRVEEPRLFASIDDAAAAIGVAPPANVIVSTEPTFFATEAPIRAPQETLHGRTIHLSMSLIRLLTTEELRAVVGHEMAHFSGTDMYWGRAFYPIYRGAVTSLVTLQAATTGLARIAALPARMVIGTFLEEFMIVEREIGRERELAADAAGGRIAGHMAMATALGKLSASVDAWPRALGDLGTEIAENRGSANVVALFARNAVEDARSSSLADEATRALGNAVDSHPLLATRLEALNVSISDAAAVVSTMRPLDSAAALLDNREALEQDLSDALGARIAPHAVALAEDRAAAARARSWLDEYEQRQEAAAERAAIPRRPTGPGPVWQSCPNCRQPLLQGVKACWSCGHRF